MGDADRYHFEVTCRCGGSLKSAKYLAGEVDKAMQLFNEDHVKCRDQETLRTMARACVVDLRMSSEVPGADRMADLLEAALDE